MNDGEHRRGTWRWGGLGSQGMHTTSSTYHLKKGKRAQRGGVPGADGGKKKELLSHRQQRESPGLREHRLPAWGTHLSRHCLPGGGRDDENAS